MTLYLTLAVVPLLVLSALTSGTETAMTAASRARFHRLAEEGDRRAALVISLLNPMIRRRLRDEQEATVDLFKATGFQGDYMRMRKCFEEPA